jgi:hypothetical protein
MKPEHAGSVVMDWEERDLHLRKCLREIKIKKWKKGI